MMQETTKWKVKIREEKGGRGEHVRYTVVSRANGYCGLKDYNLVALSLKLNIV